MKSAPIVPLIPNSEYSRTNDSATHAAARIPKIMRYFMNLLPNNDNVLDISPDELRVKS